MHAKRHLPVFLLVALLSLALAGPAHAVFCQYQGQPTSVIRFSPGFGIAFGSFSLIGPSTCPGSASAIQFSGSSAPDPTPFVGTIETCLDSATLVIFNSGTITFGMDDPLTGSPGVVIGNHLGSPLSLCRISG